MRWYERIVAAHAAVTDQVSHLERMKSERYFVWQEDGANDLSADGGHAEKAVTGFTDLFTRLEFDPWADTLEDSMTWYGISWRLRDVQYEEETGITHYTWDWEVLDENPPATADAAALPPCQRGALEMDYGEN